MPTPSCHLARGRQTGQWTIVARRVAVTALSGLLLTTPVMPQSQAPASPGQAAPTTAAPRPDKSRAQKAFQAGRSAEQSGDWKTAYADYSEASMYAPTVREYSTLKEHARFQLIQGLVDSAERQALAGNIPNARALLGQALEIDPNYEVARERLGELTSAAVETAQEKGPRLAGLPRLHPKPGTVDFDYRGTMRGAYEEIGRQFGVTVVFDGELPDRVIRFRAPKVDFDTAVMVLSRQTQTFTRVADEHTLFITADTPQNERQFAPEIEKALVLPASVTTDEMNETVRMVREMTGITRTQLDTASRTLTVRSTEQNVALAQALIGQIEQPRGELMVEIEILELNRDAAHQLGITPPESSTVFTLSPNEIKQLQAAQNNGTLLSVIQTIFGSVGALGTSTGGLGSVLPPVIAFGGGKSIFLATVPGASANFSQALNAVRSAQRILLRAQDGKPATFFVGDRYPIDFGLLSSNISPAATALASGILAGQLPQANYAVGTSPVALALGDFNHDGPTDLVVANHGDGTTNGTISVLLGVGDGTFGTQTPITIPGLSLPGGTPSTLASTPLAVAVGDFDGDGNLDIAVTDEANGNLEILFGDGRGNFTAPTATSTYATGNAPVALLATDLNGDGTVDLAVVNQENGTTNGTVSVFLNNATGSRTNTFAPRTDYPVGVLPKGIAAGNFNADTRPDLAVTNSGDNTVSILLQNTDLTTAALGTFSSSVPYATGAGPSGIAVADFNVDGKLDLAVTNQGASPGTVSILLGNGDGTFPTHTEFTTGAGPTGIVAADFTGEGNPDLAITDQTDNNLDLLIGNGDGTFTAPISLPSGNSPVAVAAADLNGDAATDAVVVNKAADNVTVTLNTVSSSTNSSSNQTAYPSADYVDLGLKIKATPRLHSGDEVTLHLEFDIKSLAGSSVNGIPILTNRSLDQTVRLREDETSVLSGIVQNNEARSVSGLPWTSSVPSVGDLTGENTANNQKTEILILVTPRALRLPPRDAPALYAGHGEPSTPPGPIPQPVNEQPQPGAPQAPPQGAQPVVTPGVGPQPGQQFPGGFQRPPPQQQ
ncbi:MAG: FG-GAP-like repeat-containing protein [Acidobacteriia bacterium]|nr:FG-GAP-like repeat-containing protein [Terriglobia bacterium]